MGCSQLYLLHGGIAALFVGLGCGLGAAEDPLYLLFLWPGLVYAALSVAYLLPHNRGAAMFTKNITTGSIPVVLKVLLAPYFVPHRLHFLIRHRCFLDRVEEPCNKVGDGLFVGRWPLADKEFPSSVTAVVDLTAEMPQSPVTVKRNVKYLCVPALDCSMPPIESFLAACRVVAAEWRGDTVYVHCLNGHGRSSCFAAIIMLLRGEHPNWHAAFAEMKKARPCISIQPPQEAFLDAVQDRIVGEGVASGGSIEMVGKSVHGGGVVRRVSGGEAETADDKGSEQNARRSRATSDHSDGVRSATQVSSN